MEISGNCIVFPWEKGQFRFILKGIAQDYNLPNGNLLLFQQLDSCSPPEYLYRLRLTFNGLFTIVDFSFDKLESHIDSLKQL